MSSHDVVCRGPASDGRPSHGSSKPRCAYRAVVAWTTLSAVKTALNIASSDTSQDARLAQFISESHHILVSEVQQEIGELVEANTAANPTVLTVRGHRLQTGDQINVSGSNCTPSIDGVQVITVIDADHLSVPVNVTVAGTSGWLNYVIAGAYYSTDGTKTIKLRKRPALSVQSVYYDPNGYFGTPPAPATPFSTSTLLVQGSDYSLYIDNDREQSSERGWIMRINGYWPKPNERVRGILVSQPGWSQGNLMVSYTAGRRFLPLDLQRASNLLVAISRATAKLGLPTSAESLDYYSYTLAGQKEVAEMIGSIHRVLGNYKEFRWGDSSRGGAP